MTKPAAIVVLGAMFGARYPELVPAAQARGLTVLGVETPSPGYRRFDAARQADPSHPLAGIAELAWIAGTRHEEIIEQVIAWQAGYSVRAVLALGEDFVVTAGLVADYLGLPSPGLRASQVCRDKLLQRKYLAAWSPRSRRLVPGEDAAGWARFPAVLKPTGRNASSGVQRVDDPDQLARALGTFDQAETLLFEQLVTGPEVSVETLVQGGNVVRAFVTGKRTNSHHGRYFAEMGHTVPDQALTAYQRAEVLAVNQAVLGRLAFADGIAHAEYRVDPAGRTWLMEIAARAPGDSILTLYHLATGQAMEDAMIAIALGEPVAYPSPRRAARQVYLEHRPGVLRDVTADGLATEITWLPECWKWPAVRPAGRSALHMVVVGRARGDALGEIRESGDRALMYVIEASDTAELDTLEASCTAAITIDVAAG